MLRVLILLMAFVCAAPGQDPAALRQFPLDSAEGVPPQAGVAFDPIVSSDGRGALRIAAKGPVTVRLFETGDLDIENARLTYQARVRTEDVKGRVYLEMWCQFGKKGEFFSRGFQSVLTGTADWSTLWTPFFLKKGENPTNVKLNLVVEGPGTAWIDDIRVLKGPLQ